MGITTIEWARPLSRVLSLATLVWLTGCASEVVRYPTELIDAKLPQRQLYVASQSASIRLDSRYQRTIGAGTEFVEVGVIKQGTVLKPRNSVLTVEGAHIHEAYPVIQNSRIVGFYLPVEKAFSPLSQPAAFHLQQKESMK